MKKVLFICLTLCVALSLLLSACAKTDDLKVGYDMDGGGRYSYPYYNKDYANTVSDGVMSESAAIYPFDYDGSNYTKIAENESVKTSEKSDIYVSLDNNTASYTNVRGAINRMKNGDNYTTIYPDSVRVEEMLNYFSYDYPSPEDEDFSFTYSLFDAPYKKDVKLLTIGLKAKEVQTSDVPNNIVLLIDVSGSMYGADRLGLIQEGFKLIAENLKPQDRVSIVTYASGVRCALDGAMGDEGNKIRAVIEDLEAMGSTNGEGGIELAYEIAQKHFIQGGNNRVILAPDGDFNIGKATADELTNLISGKRDSGIYLSVIGVGYGNLQSDMMEALALNGNGNWSYLDSVNEARKFLVEEFGGNFFVLAKDAKLKIDFNAETVEEYRLIGYENKQMSQEEFEDESKDAGEIGSGHSVTAVFEVKLKENFEEDKIAQAVLHYKNTSDESKELVSDIEFSQVARSDDELSVRDKFIASIVEFALLIRNSEYKGDASLSEIIELLKDVKNGDNEYYKDFYNLVETYASVVDASKE